MQACTRDMRRNQEVSGHLGFCSKHYGALGLHAHTRSLKEDVLSRIHTVHDVPGSQHQCKRSVQKVAPWPRLANPLRRLSSCRLCAGPGTSVVASWQGLERRHLLMHEWLRRASRKKHLLELTFGWWLKSFVTPRSLSAQALTNDFVTSWANRTAIENEQD